MNLYFAMKIIIIKCGGGIIKKYILILKKIKKINLILAVISSKVIYYKITSSQTNEDIFKLFMEKLYESLSE